MSVPDLEWYIWLGVVGSIVTLLAFWFAVVEARRARREAAYIEDLASEARSLWDDRNKQYLVMHAALMNSTARGLREAAVACDVEWARRELEAWAEGCLLATALLGDAGDNYRRTVLNSAAQARTAASQIKVPENLEVDIQKASQWIEYAIHAISRAAAEMDLGGGRR